MEIKKWGSQSLINGKVKELKREIKSINILVKILQDINGNISYRRTFMRGNIGEYKRCGTFYLYDNDKKQVIIGGIDSKFEYLFEAFGLKFDTERDIMGHITNYSSYFE